MDKPTEPEKLPIRHQQIALAFSDPEKFGLLKKIAANVNKKTYKEPKKNCKHCYGRGFIGYLNGLKSLPVPCRCVYVRPIMGMRKYV